MRRRWWHLVASASAAVAVTLGGGAPAAAHPLGNFTVNHLNALTFEARQIVNDAVVDLAEIPTAQERSAVDVDRDGTITDAEFAGYGERRCADLAADQTLLIDGQVVAFSVETTSFVYVPGEAGLPTGRLECRLTAPADLSVARTLEFTDAFDPRRVGWHEITAVGVDVRIVDSPVAASSVTDGLRSYPVDLLSSPTDVRTAAFDLEPAVGTSTAPEQRPTEPLDPASVDRGALAGLFDKLTTTFDDLIARRDLTLGVGLLAVGLALVLGASHALLPGHGKAVMAAYIAGRQGSIADAVVVGATVTGTHTGGVLVLGLALTLSTSLAGEMVLGWLGVASGLLVAGLGVGFLISLLRRRAAGQPARLHGHSHGSRFGHHHHHPDVLDHRVHDDHDHGHDHGHGHDDHDHDHDDHDHDDHDHDHDHGHHDDVGAPGVAGDRISAARDGRGDGGHGGAIDSLVREHHEVTSAQHDADPTKLAVADPASGPRRISRPGLVVMGVAGGLVPSPSALIIFLSAIALGRTAFGVLLVLAYGAGMAFTLTIAGIALVVVRDRYQRRAITEAGRVRTAARRWANIAPFATAILVVAVGAGLTIRSLANISL